MDKWFTVDRIDEDTYIISEYRHWEETHCYLLNGSGRSLLIDTGLGICNIYDEVVKLTDQPVTAVATHIHWDHIGGHKYFPDFYAHEEELGWLSGGFPLSMETVRGMVVDRCELPEGYDVGSYEMFQGRPSVVLRGGEEIDIGGRMIKVFHTPGHSPGHMCFWEPERGYLFTGDLIYKDTLFAYYPSQIRELIFPPGKDGASSCGKGVSGAPFPGYPAGDYRPYEGCFPGIEGGRETASWERDF